MEAEQVRQALERLLGERRTGDLSADLVQAAQEALRRRVQNSTDGGLVLAELRALGVSWREIERTTGIPKATAQRWAEPPPR